MAELKITAVEPAFATGYCDELFIGTWRGPVSVTLVREWARQYDNMLARFPRGFVVFCLIEAQTPPPDAASRRAITEEIERLGSAIHAIASVAEANGFAGAAVRSVLLAMSNAASKRLDRRMFGSCDEASAWLSPYLESASRRFTTGREILLAVEAFRRMIDPRGATAPSVAGARAYSR
jgi:hypothetical protein